MDENVYETNQQNAVIGCLLGTAVGDALGLACEGLSRRRQQRLYPNLSGPCLLRRRSMVSDDTEHTCMVAQALIDSAGDERAFQKSLARRMRFWLLGLPAGIGWATLRSLFKLCLGASPNVSGVWSAGNGPAMRSALIGICYGDDFTQLRALVRVSTRITHTDPKAEIGAIAIAVAASVSVQGGADESLNERFLMKLPSALEDLNGAVEFLVLAHRISDSVLRGDTTQDFAVLIGAKEGVSGYVYQTVPVVLHAWLRNPTDFHEALLEIVRCGGDTDTTAAILGAIIGARVGKSGIPATWISSLCEWPRTSHWMETLGRQLTEVSRIAKPQKALSLPLFPVMLRNAFFTSVVLAHGFRRLLPPY